MKVIDNGIFVGQKITCATCRCVFEIEAGDSPDEAGTVHGSELVRIAFFSCPQCGHDNELRSNNIVEAA